MPAATSTTVVIQHNSMQFSDDTEHHAHDARAVFDYARDHDVWAVTGTEAGASPANHELRSFLMAEARAHGYSGYFHRYGDWVAVDRARFKDRKFGYEGPFIPGTHRIGVAEGAHSPRGITWMQGHTEVGLVTVGSAHFLTKLSIAASGSNDRLIRGVAKFGREYGAGRKIVLFDADTNEPDRRIDVFKGIAPFTTIADELGEYHATHEGGAIIDVIASYNADSRVKAKAYRVLDDSALHLFSDHLVLVGTYDVKPL
jgi:hypothetical protein